MGVVITRPTSQEELVAYLSENRFIVNTRVSRVMLQVDRKHFVSRDPYADSSQQIPGSSYSISAPNIHAAALELFKRHIFNGARVLDVGPRTGYLTACLAIMAGADGMVVGVENSPELIDKAIGNIKKEHKYLMDSRRVIFVQADGSKGWNYYAPYDAIHVGGAMESVPDEMIAQLIRGGRLVVPLGSRGSQQLFTIDKMPSGEIRRQAVMTVTFAPLVHSEASSSRDEAT